MAAPNSWRNFFAVIPQYFLDSLMSARESVDHIGNANKLANHLYSEYDHNSYKRAKREYHSIFYLLFSVLRFAKAVLHSVLYEAFALINKAVGKITAAAELLFDLCVNVIFHAKLSIHSRNGTGLSRLENILLSIYEGVTKPLPQGIFALSASLVARTLRAILAIPFYFIGSVINSVHDSRAFALTSVLALSALLDNAVTALLISPLYIKDAVVFVKDTLGYLFSCCFKRRAASESKQYNEVVRELSSQQATKSPEDTNQSASASRESLNFGQLKNMREEEHRSTASEETTSEVESEVSYPSVSAM